MGNIDFSKTLELALSYRTVELMGSGEALSSFLAENLTQEDSCLWIHASDARRDAFLAEGIHMQKEHFAETSFELLSLARKAFKKHPRHLSISLPTSYDGTRTTSLLKLAGLTKTLTHRRLFFPRPRIGSEKVTRVSTYRTTRALLFN